MFDESLATRVRGLLANKINIIEKRLFGGTGFMQSGHLVVAVWKRMLIVRVGTAAYEKALREPFVQEFNVTGKSMRGWVMIGQHGIEDDDQLQDWIQRAMKFVATLPPKPASSTRSLSDSRRRRSSRRTTDVDRAED